MKYLVLISLILDLYGIAFSNDQKRLVLHSDLDIGQALQELRHEINATKQENLAQKVQMEQEIVALKAEISQLRKGQGSTYIRWGRTVCPSNGTETVYSGYTAGSSYASAGGAAKSICLPQNPSWASHIDGLQSLGGLVYGTEFETKYSSFDQHAFGKDMMDQDVPCVVCHSSRATTIMIPGSTSCYSGWTQEYTGYLMSDSASHDAASDYVCVDKDPEAVFHGEADLNGNLFYFVEVNCGSLPCQEYPQGRELACVVCSR